MIGLLACGSVEREHPGPGGGAPAPVRLETVTAEGETDADGVLDHPFEVPAGAASFQLAVTTDSSEWIGVSQLRDPRGTVVFDRQDWADGVQRLTDGVVGHPFVLAFDWPILSSDPPEPGTWTATLSTGVPDRFPAVPLEIHRVVKFDPDLARAAVHVQLVWAEGVSDDPANVDAVDLAVAHWTELWAARGLDLEVTHVESALDPIAIYLYFPDPAITALAEDMGAPALQVILVESIPAFGLAPLGVSPSIPGTVLPSPQTLVAVTIGHHAGTDGVFDPEEIGILGETFAHEVGHFMGLHHPIEADFSLWDALPDTPDCTAMDGCEALFANVMFPYPYCDPVGGCLPQVEITDDQLRLLQLYPAAL